MADTPNNAPSPQQVNDAQHLDNMTSLQQPSAAEQSPITQSGEVRGDAPVANTPTPNPDNPSLFNEPKNPNNKVVEVESQKTTETAETNSNTADAADQKGRGAEDLGNLRGGNGPAAFTVQANGEGGKGDTAPEATPGVNASGGNSGFQGPTGGGAAPRAGQAPAGTPANAPPTSAPPTTTPTPEGRAAEAAPAPIVEAVTNLVTPQALIIQDAPILANSVATVSSEIKSACLKY